uniref:Uncharacterized protein n=1 Tax=Manihot esculenta TaxID=3983 RepID=A0A2C9VUL5_MANES
MLLFILIFLRTVSDCQIRPAQGPFLGLNRQFQFKVQGNIPALQGSPCSVSKSILVLMNPFFTGGEKFGLEPDQLLVQFQYRTSQ